MNEQAIHLTNKSSLVGILSEPSTSVGVKKPAIIILNAGLLHRVGPHRLYVKIARNLAAQGFKVIRFDYSGIGDSQMRMDNVSYEKSVIEETREFMDYLSTANDIDEFILMGICSGADNAFRIAGVDDRVSGCLFIDSFAVTTAAFFWRTYARRFISIRSWFLLLTGKSDLWQALRRYISSNERNGDVLNPFPDPPSKDEILADIKKLLDRGVEMCFIYSGGPSYYNYLVNFKPHFQKLQQLENFKMFFFKRANHTFTLIHYQQALMQAITEWLSFVNEKRCA